MPRTKKTAAAQALVTSIQAAPDPVLDLIASLAETAASLMLGSYTLENWQDSPAIDDLQRTSEMLQSAGRQVSHAVEEALARAEAARDEPRP